jgi:STE24 endopeptidase
VSLRADAASEGLSAATAWGDHRSVALMTGLLLLVLAAAIAALTAPPTTRAAVAGSSVVAQPDRDFSATEQAAGDGLASQVRPWALSSLVAGLVVSLVLGLSPLGARIVNGIGTTFGLGTWTTLIAGTIALLMIGRVVTLPFAVAARRPRVEVGLSTQSWSAWGADVAKSFALSVVVVVAAVCVLRALALASPGWWWAWAALCAAGTVVLLSFLLPVVVEPLFNRFTPMPDGALRTSLLQLADDEGVAVDDVLVADASRRTTALNAYVSGLGSTRRIVVYDTLLAEATPDEVRSVVAHELGHAAENDVRDATLIGALGVAGAVALLGFLLTWPALLQRAGADSVVDPAVVALVLALAAIGTFIATPASNAVSRRVETRADIRALEATNDPVALAQVQRRLALTNRSDVTPPAVLFAWFGTHPTSPERIALARAWSAANDGVTIPDLAGRPLLTPPKAP